MSIQAELLRVFLRAALRRRGGNAPGGFSLEKARQLANRGRRGMRPPRGTRIEPVMVGGRPAHWITPPGVEAGRTILYLHGGGWVYGWMGFYDRFVSQLAQAAGSRAMGIDYRLAPEQPFPAALEDCLAAYRYLLDQGVRPERIAILGDSAGGNLVLATLLAARQQGLPLPGAGVCLSPATDLSQRGETYETNRRSDVILGLAFADFAGNAYVADHDRMDPLLSPYFGDLRGLPPLLIQAGGGEILLCDAQKFARKAAEAGVEVTLSIYPGMWHVWQPFHPILPEARKAVQEVGEFVGKKI